MVLAGCRTATKAARIATVVDDGTLYVFTMERLVVMAALHRPEIILLDAKMGGSAERAIDRIPQLLRLSPEARLIVMSPSSSVGERKEGREMGAFAFVNYRAENFEQQLERAIGRAAQAKPSASAQRRRRHLH
jgi:DNA-binding NarL/FixJ family response regulator